MPTASDVTQRREGHTGRLQRSQRATVFKCRGASNVRHRLHAVARSAVYIFPLFNHFPRSRGPNPNFGRSFACVWLGGTAPQIWSPTAVGGLIGSRRTEKRLKKGTLPSWQKPRPSCADGYRVALPASRMWRRSCRSLGACHAVPFTIPHGQGVHSQFHKASAERKAGYGDQGDRAKCGNRLSHAAG